ncbi:quinate 5-dehydrogenase [Anaerosinus gibii]|uniref:Quinate 5-dehydrogenase n=1 Tax=Selenobaculum gibii TaxID=3054208 RepID=A0A9Y2AID2_9FIRM|nr:quinate 5-dehydrogenase [Selenobaculum gbiensis]WIW69975.1 quinate 5-dehydrogenase [Selenobaculum gbiensis]
MKRIVSISLGSSTRDHQVVTHFAGEEVSIKRIGTDGNVQVLRQHLQELDGKVDAFGLGGTDLYIYAGDKQYTFKESKKLLQIVKKTPIVDGSGLKNTLEEKVIYKLQDNKVINFQNLSVLLVCGVDRFGMARSLSKISKNIVFGDLLYGLSIPIPIHHLTVLNFAAKLILPIITQVPIRYLYPTGKAQEQMNPHYTKYFLDADVIAGDFHIIKRNLPPKLEGKIIITNTVTKEDEFLLRTLGIKLLITTTPLLEGRSFGTNVIEAVLVALANKGGAMKQNDYEWLIQKYGLKPRIQFF